MDDHTFIEQLRRRDHDAFSRLVARHHQAMLVLARSIAGDVWAEEVVQEAWVSVYRALPDFKGKASVKTWLFTIVRNEARSRYRKEARTVKLPEDKGGGTEAGLEDWLDNAFGDNGRWRRLPGGSEGWEMDSPEALLQEEQLALCIERTLGLLPPEQQAVFLLRDQQQLDMESVCNILEVSHSNARVLLHRARLRLFKVINQYQETGEC